MEPFLSVYTAAAAKIGNPSGFSYEEAVVMVKQVVGQLVIDGVSSPPSGTETEWRSYMKAGPTVWLPEGAPGPLAGSKSAWVKTGDTRKIDVAAYTPGSVAIPGLAKPAAVPTKAAAAAAASSGLSRYMPYILVIGGLFAAYLVFSRRKGSAA